MAHGYADAAAFSLSTESHGAVEVIRLAGELDIHTTAQLREAVDGLLVDDHRVHLVVDLTGLTFIDSSGLGALVRVQRQCRTLRGSLVVVADEGPALRLMTLTGMTHVLRIVESLDAALAAPPDPEG